MAISVARERHTQACQTDLTRPRRFADPVRSIAADSLKKFADSPRRLSATRRLRLPAQSGPHRPGRRRAGRFVQLYHVYVGPGNKKNLLLEKFGPAIWNRVSCELIRSLNAQISH